MPQLSSLLNGLSRTLSVSKGRVEGAEEGREAADELKRDAKKNDMIIKSCSRSARTKASRNSISVFSQRGEKGMNQDCYIVWEEFGCQDDMIFCGVFDGHGHWGHYVSKTVRESLPPSLLCNWQETVAMDDKKISHFDVWKQSYLRTCAAVDRELQHNRQIDAFNSGTTALTIVKQSDLMVIANVGDSRAVLATTSDDGSLIPVQLTVDFKPNLPEEAERITQCNGRVLCLQDEPGVHRIWLPHDEAPGLAMSRAFGDFCVKDFGLISVPEVMQRRISSRDQFIVLATDGVWDVVSNKEAIDIVSSTKDRKKSAKRLVECATRAWKKKRRGIAVDDCSAICLFFHSPLQSDC